jgi:crotonobetainyl-CoA:carnitine CoA-transferase CaiB-like acyl-CoA transferase
MTAIYYLSVYPYDCQDLHDHLFIENYHRSGLSKHGLSPLELAKLRPGIIYVSESAYGEVGPWQYRRGAEQLAETVTGIAAELGAIDSPKDSLAI